MNPLGYINVVKQNSFIAHDVSPDYTGEALSGKHQNRLHFLCMLLLSVSHRRLVWLGTDQAHLPWSFSKSVHTRRTFIATACMVFFQLFWVYDGDDDDDDYDNIMFTMEMMLIMFTELFYGHVFYPYGGLYAFKS